MRVLMIDNYDSFTYNLVQYLQEEGADVDVCRNDEKPVEALGVEQYDRIVVSPGPGRPDGAGVSLDIIEAAAGKVPLLGVCLGHQCIVQAFGGEIGSAQKIMHGKVSSVQHDQKGVFHGLPQGFQATRYHSLAAERDVFPDSLEVTATAEDGEIMGARHRTLDIEGVQFHPESILTQHGHEMLRNFLAPRS